MEKSLKNNNLIVTNENYFSKEIELEYTGSTQIKSFMKCEKETLARINGEWEKEVTDALLTSSYIDAYVSDEIVKFEQKHPEMFTNNGKKLYAKYEKLLDIINQAENDSLFWKYLQGEHQKIMTGEINGVKVKIKIDSYFDDKCIVDEKSIANLKPIWNEKLHIKQNFIDYYDYVLQGALYQEVVRQNIGKKLPFIIAVLTKEKISERALLNIPQEILDNKLIEISEYLPHIKDLKEGKVEPTECGNCDFCLSKAKTSCIYNYNEYFSMKGGY